MPRWTLPAVVAGDVVVIGVLYAVLGWPALIVGTPLVLCSIVVMVLVRAHGSGSPAPHVARAFVPASGAPGSGPRSAGHGDDDWYLRPHRAGHPYDDGWTAPHHGGTTWSDPGCADAGPSGSDSGSSSSSSSD
jgi:hypothetical protein